MSSFKEYIDLHNQHVTQYGCNAIVIVQMGSFYCMYATEDMGPDIKQISQLLNVVLTRKNKKIKKITPDNPLMIGVPTVSMTKYIQILIQNSFTVVVVDQTAPPPRVKREVTGIYSPGVWLENIQNDTQTMVMLYITRERQRSGGDCTVIGMASIDLTTGHSTLHEACDTIVDTTAAMDECMAFLAQCKPTETMVYFDQTIDESNKSVVEKWQQKTIEYMNITNNVKFIGIHGGTGDWFDKEFLKLNYQTEFLSKVFRNVSDPIEAFELEGGWMRNAWVMLLIRCYNQRKQIIEALKPPDKFQATGRMNLGSNVVSALNVVASDTTNNNSLFKIINFTSTAMGRRYLKHCLLNPMSCIKQIKGRHNAIEAIEPHWDAVESYLKNVYDIVRLHRRMSLKILLPHEFATMYESYVVIVEMLEYINESTDLNIKSKKHIKKVKCFLKQYNNVFNHCAMMNPDEAMIFKRGNVDSLDAVTDDIEGKTSFLSKLAHTLSEMVDDKKLFKKEGATQAVRVEQNNRDGYYLITTKRRGKLLENAFATMDSTIEVDNDTINISDIVFNKHQRGNDVIITLTDMNERSSNMVELKEQLDAIIKKEYETKLEEMYAQYHECFDKIVAIVSQIDFFKSGAKCATQHRYCKPTIIESKDSFFTAQQLRHPIVERINTNTQYIPHDVGLGHDLRSGILLYGLNSAGKSTIMKAIGLSIIMAQAGLYVPAASFTVAPFESLMTRITGNDDLFRGLSSFDLEMTELRAILKRTGCKTMVIGDELCRGTEAESGIAIVATMLEMLTKTKSKFIFATHMHVLNDIKDITDNTAIAFKHLTVEYCKKTNIMKFDRKLKDTSGPKRYGLNVARHIIDDATFNRISSKYEQVHDKAEPLVATKKSNYCKDLYMTKCELCNHVPTEGMIPLETHHIVPQRLADKDGFLLTKPHVHKNTKSNLVVLCHKCHDCIDNNKVIITGFTETSKGNYLNVDVGKTNIKIKNKWFLLSSDSMGEKPQ